MKARLICLIICAVLVVFSGCGSSSPNTTMESTSNKDNDTSTEAEAITETNDNTESETNDNTATETNDNTANESETDTSEKQGMIQRSAVEDISNIRPQKDGFDPDTNQQFKLNNVIFSIPSYFVLGESESSETLKVFYAETGKATTFLLITCSYNSGMSQEKFDANSNALLESFSSAFQEAQIQAVFERNVAGLKGYSISCTGVVDAVPTDGFRTIAYYSDSHEVFSVALVQSVNSRYDYTDDYKHIVDSIVLIPVEKKEPGTGDLGDYHIAIKSAAFDQDYDDSPVIIVTYAWTNNSNETASAATSVSVKAFQDGVELDRSFTYGLFDSSYDSVSSMKDVRPGATIEIPVAFVLSNKSSPVEVEISELFSFSKDTVNKTFSLH